MIKAIVKREGQGLILFLPESRASRGFMVCWSPVDGHTEASLDYYRGLKNPLESQDVSGLIRVYENIGEYMPIQRVYRDSSAMQATRWDY